MSLTTVAAVRQRLQKPDSETSQDAEIAALIESASTLIQGYTQREFSPSGDATRTFIHDGQGLVDLAPYDLQAASAVAIDGQALDSADYGLRPKPASHGVYSWLTVPKSSAQQEVTITGTWGFPAVPADVSMACISTVALWLRREVSAFSRVFKLDEGMTERPDALPSAVQAMLDRYRLVRHG